MNSQIIQTSLDAVSVDGPGSWVNSGGYAEKTSGRQVERTVKITGNIGTAAVFFEVDFGDDDPATILDNDGSDKTFTRTGTFQVLLSPCERLRAVVSGVTGGESITVKVL